MKRIFFIGLVTLMSTVAMAQAPQFEQQDSARGSHPMMMREGRRQMRNPQEMAKARTAKMVQKYGLNEEQAAQLLKLNEEQAAKRGEHKGMKGQQGGPQGQQRGGQGPQMGQGNQSQNTPSGQFGEGQGGKRQQGRMFQGGPQMKRGGMGFGQQMICRCPCCQKAMKKLQAQREKEHKARRAAYDKSLKKIMTKEQFEAYEKDRK